LYLKNCFVVNCFVKINNKIKCLSPPEISIEPPALLGKEGILGNDSYKISTWRDVVLNVLTCINPNVLIIWFRQLGRRGTRYTRLTRRPSRKGFANNHKKILLFDTF